MLCDVVRRRRRRRRRWAHAPVIHAFDQKKRVAWVPISMHTCGSFFYNYGAPLGGPSGRRSSATKASEHSGVMYVKASVLKSYTGSVSRPATILFANNTPVKVYCGCAVEKSGLCCHVIALLIELNYYRENKKLYMSTCHALRSFRSGIRRELQ